MLSKVELLLNFGRSVVL